MTRTLTDNGPGNSSFATLWVCATLLLCACSSEGEPTGSIPTSGGESFDSGATTGAPGTISPGGSTGSATGSSSGTQTTTGGTLGASTGTGMGGAGAGASSATGGTSGMTTTAGGLSGTATSGTGAIPDAGGATPADGGDQDDGGATTGGSRPLSSTLDLPTMKESPGVAPFFNVWRPTDLSAVQGKLPIVVWNNGACSRNDQVFKPMFENWASGGYVVLSLTSGGGSSSTTIADQKGLIDWVVAQAQMAGGQYEGKLDLERIAAAGNSCGGITSLGLASMDERVAAVFVLSGSSAVGRPDMTVIGGIEAPVAYVVGGTEDIARSNAEADYEAFAAGIPAMIVKRSSGDHLLISNDAMVMVDAADISINWLDLTLFGLQPALDALNAPTVCADCESGLWTLTSKNLETLVK